MAFVAAAAAISCVIAVAGCGGDDDDGNSSVAATSPQSQAPTSPDSGKFRPEGTPTQSTPSTTTPNPNAERRDRLLAPFRECLNRRGVEDLTFLDPRARASGSLDQPEMQRQIQAAIACIPQLPPRLREGAERLKRRYERRQGL
jgi:hypothetical protein